MGILNRIKQWGKKLLGAGISADVVALKQADEAASASRSVDVIPYTRKNRAARRLAKFGNRIRCTRNHKFHAKRANGALQYNAVTHNNVNSKVWQLAALLQAFKPWGQYA